MVKSLQKRDALLFRLSCAFMDSSHNTTVHFLSPGRLLITITNSFDTDHDDRFTSEKERKAYN